MSDIPLEFSPRPQQVQLLDFVKSSIADGKKFIMVDAPTGVGKSYFAIMFQLILLSGIFASGCSFDIAKPNSHL